jgi:NAD(P)-dependent dehydrogenase (short-subunit alcohol dehydrogenase family)
VAIAKLVADVGPSLQVLHYNTGVLHYDRDANLLTRTIDDECFESLQSDMHINIGSCLAAIKVARPGLRSQIPGTSSILLSGGGLGVNPSGNFLALSVGKTAVRAAAQALFELLKDEGIHVATVTVSRLVSPGSEPSNAIAEEF